MIKNLKEGIFESCQVLIGQLQDICICGKIQPLAGFECMPIKNVFNSDSLNLSTVLFGCI